MNKNNTNYTKLALTCVLLLTSVFCFAQTVNMPTSGTATYAPGVPTNASITFNDNGGAGNYSNNCNSTYTFCPQTAGEVVCITFGPTSETEANYDYLYIYSGKTATGPVMNGTTNGANLVSNLTFISTTADGCLTIKFTSDGSGVKSGWSGIVSASSKCTAASATASQVGTDTFICPSTAVVPSSTTISFDGTASTALVPKVIDGWVWEWGDGTTTTTLSGTTSHTYGSYGAFKEYLTVNDNAATNCVVPAGGCPSSNTSKRTIYVLRPPTVVAQSVPLQKICEGSIANLNAQVQSSSVQAKPEDPTPGVLFLPDGSGVSYTSSVILKSFPSGALVSASCLPKIKVMIEHEYNDDLDIQIIAPDGKSAYLMNRNNNGLLTGGVGTYSLGLCAPANDNASPVLGTCGEYMFVNSGASKTLAGQTGSTTISTATNCVGATTKAIPTGTYLATNSTTGATIANPLFGLIGAPINGNWTLKVTDHTSLDNGYVCDWAILFPTTCYGLEDITPDLSRGSWSADPSNPATITLNAARLTGSYIPTGTGGTTNDGANNTDNPGYPLTVDPNGSTITNNQVNTFSTPGTYLFDFNYVDSANSAPICDYKLSKTIKVFDKPDVSQLKCICTAPTRDTLLFRDIPSIVNNNHAGADIGQWEYSIDGFATAGRTDSMVTGLAPVSNGGTYTVSVRNKAFPTCISSIDCSVALPVELLGFYAKEEGSFVRLEWETASEKNNSHFVIEKSTNGINFKAIGQVSGAGNSSTLHQYSFVDRKVDKGTSYYRLKQVDFDAKFVYSLVVAVELSIANPGIGIASIQPNPLPKGATSLDIIFYSDKDITATVLIRSILGQDLYKKQVLLIDGENKINVSLDGLQLTAGTYFVEVQTPSANAQKRLMIEK